MTLGYNYQGNYRHMIGWQFIPQSSIYKNLYYAFDAWSIFWTYRDNFLIRNKYSDNIGLGLNMVLFPLEWTTSIIWDYNIIEYLFIPNSGINYFPYLEQTDKLGLCGVGIYGKLNSAAYIFHRNKWCSFTPSSGISLIIKGIKLNVGYGINYETNFTKTYKIPSLTFSIDIMGLERIDELIY
jgi:hypothetical protein